MKFPSPRWTLAALALWLIFLIVTLPAQHLLGWFGGDRLAAQGIAGTVWSGRAERVAVNGFAAGPLVWKLRPSALLTGSIEFQTFVQSARGGGELRVGKGLFGSTRVRDARLNLDAAELGRQLRLSLVALRGDVQADLDALTIDGGTIDALQGNVVWQNAQVAQANPVSLGTLTMRIEKRDERIVGTLGDQGGPLELGGELVVEATRAYRLDALLKPRATADQQLRQALGMLGAPDAQGRYRLRYAGQL